MVSLALLIYTGYFFAVAKIVQALWRYRTPEARIERALRNRESE